MGSTTGYSTIRKLFCVTKKVKLAIVIPTYQRVDGTTPKYLTRALESVRSQTYSDYRVYLIGDRYDNNGEFEYLASSIIRPDQIYWTNLPYALEREKYQIGTRELWCSGGVNATNTGINRALDHGHEWICHLDHDDWWESDHLETIVRAINSVNNVGFVYTCARHIVNYLPMVTLDDSLIYSYPVPCNVIHSSVCINHSRIPLLYRDVFAETNTVLESDIDMWTRVTAYMQQNSISSVLCARLTVHHVLEKH